MTSSVMAPTRRPSASMKSAATRDPRGGGERDAGAFEDGEEGHRRGTREGRRGHGERNAELAAGEQAERPRVGDGVPEEGLHQDPRHAERAAGDDRRGHPGEADLEDDLAGQVARLRPRQGPEGVGQGQRDLPIGQRQQRERGQARRSGPQR